MSAENDLALLQDEIRCLRKRFKSTISTSGGYIDGSITAPGSSVYPDSWFEDCECVEVTFERVDPTNICSVQETTEGGLGDLAQPSESNIAGGLFVFDALCGVWYKDPNESEYTNRNTGLASTDLEHGLVDPWWWRKVDPHPDNAILWMAGAGFIRISRNAGRSYWEAVTPTVPTGYDLANITFTQVFPNPYIQDNFFVSATDGTTTWIVSTTNDGIDWTWFEVDYNSVITRLPIWMDMTGVHGEFLWMTTWGDNKLRLLRIDMTPGSMSIEEEIDLGDCTKEELDGRYFIASPVTPLDNTDLIYVYGRMNDPQSLGTAHIIMSDDVGASWSVIENSWDLDWCGSLKLSLSDGNDNYKLYSVRNSR